MFADRKLGVEAQPAAPDRLEDDFHRHHLGKRSRRERLVGILRKKDRAGRAVDEQRFLCLGFDPLGFVLRSGRTREAPTREDSDPDDHGETNALPR